MFAVANLARRLKESSRALDDRQPAELATHKARVGAQQARSMRPKSNKDDLSAELIPCDRADSHGQHGSAIMLMAWRSALPLAAAKVLLEVQTRGPAGRRTEHFLKNPRRQYGKDTNYPPYCRRRFLISSIARALAARLGFSPFRRPVGAPWEPHWRPCKGDVGIWLQPIP